VCKAKKTGEIEKRQLLISLTKLKKKQRLLQATHYFLLLLSGLLPGASRPSVTHLLNEKTHSA
jgi:hypothetical protein